MLLVLHLGGMAFWLGGMGLVLLILRPVTDDPFAGNHAPRPPEQGERLALQALLFKRLIPVMSYAMPITLASGWIMAYLAYGRPMLWPWALNAMQTTGLVMGGLVLLTRFGPYAMLLEGDRVETTIQGERIIRLIAISCGLGGLSLVFAALLRN